MLLGLHYTVDFAASAASHEIFGGAGRATSVRADPAESPDPASFDIARQGDDPPVGRRHDDVDHLHRAKLVDDLSRREAGGMLPGDGPQRLKEAERHERYRKSAMFGGGSVGSGGSVAATAFTFSHSTGMSFCSISQIVS